LRTYCNMKVDPFRDLKKVCKFVFFIEVHALHHFSLLIIMNCITFIHILCYEENIHIYPIRSSLLSNLSGY
jgi:hypothetical protein